MKVKLAPRLVRIKGGLPGLSERLIDEHETLYQGYVNKVNEIRERLDHADLDAANATYSDVRELKREELFAADAVRLHEAYFDNLGGGGQLAGTIQDWINEDFGSRDAWQREFLACGIAGRGWVVLAYDLTDGRLHNFMTDIHSDGVWAAIPLLVLDVYEHAYYLDYGTARKKYLDAFTAAVDWNVVNNRIEQHGLREMRPAA